MDTLTKARHKELRGLRTAKGRREAGRFLAAGKKVVAEAVRAGAVEELLITPDFAEADAGYLDALGFGGPVSSVGPKALGTLDASVTPSGVMAVCAMPAAGVDDMLAAGLTACFVDVQDPGNLGTMIRTADWFAAGAVMLTAGSVDPYNEKAVAASMGSLFHVPIYVSQDLSADLARLRDAGVRLVATTPHGSQADLPAVGRRCLVMGGESRGLPEGYAALCTDSYTIPGGGRAESLNLAVSFGIAMHALTSNRA